MGGKFEIGRIRGLPVFIDASFIILIFLWGQSYFIGGDTRRMSMGFLLIVGLSLSILIHELAHAIAGHNLGVAPSHIELNGLGGLCYWAQPMRPEAWRRIAISLVGPLSNLLLYGVFELLTSMVDPRGQRAVYHVTSMLAWANWWMFVFNMLPAFPLDGGKALEALLGKGLTFTAARLVVGVLGLCLAAFCAYLGLGGVPPAWLPISGGTWMLVMAFLLGLENYMAIQGASNPPWQRRN
jgi:Zn-dependent protease